MRMLRIIVEFNEFHFHDIYTVFQKSSTPAHIDNSVNSQRIFKIPSLSHSLENLG